MSKKNLKKKNAIPKKHSYLGSMLELGNTYGCPPLFICRNGDSYLLQEDGQLQLLPPKGADAVWAFSKISPDQRSHFELSSREYPENDWVICICDPKEYQYEVMVIAFSRTELENDPTFTGATAYLNAVLTKVTQRNRPSS